MQYIAIAMLCYNTLVLSAFVIVSGMEYNAVSGKRRVNYCGARMCRNSNAHTFCQFPPGPSPECIGYIEAQLTKDEKSRLLARLNRRRNEAASGRLRGLPSAGDMLKMRWIEELAIEAQLWANQCRPPSHPEERDECRDLYSTTVGQCIASVVGEAPGLRVESMVDMWYMQSLAYKGNVTSYVPPKSDRYYYGDFGQMMWARSYMVGCGRSRFMIPWQGRLRSVERLVCNMSPAGPAPFRALWAPAAPATDCPPRSHPDRTLTALCNYQFEMDVSDVVNNTMTIEHILLNSVLDTEKNESLFNIGSLDELYLTNLAIVTMDNIESSTSLHNSIQKRGIVEAIDLDNYNNILKHKRSDMKTMKQNYQNMTRKLTKKRISIIGRPKTYNMEDLTEIGDDVNENNNEIIEEVPKNFNEVYEDYKVVDAEEETETTITQTLDKKKDVHERQTVDNIKSSIFPVTIKLNDTEPITENLFSLENNATDLLQLLLKDTTANVTELNTNAIEDFNETMLSKDKGVEDYLTDPETVRQLQQALDRMEHDQQPSKIISKVRRELRETPLRPTENTTNTSEEERNKTGSTDRGPMLNMVLKYMPYFKEYEGEILGKPNSADVAYPSIVFVSIVWFY